MTRQLSIVNVYTIIHIHLYLPAFVVPVNYLPNVLWGNLIQMCVEEPFMDILNIVCWNLELEMIFAWMVEVPGTGPCQAVGGQSAGDPGPLPPPPRHHRNLPSSAPSVSQSVCTITEKAPTRVLSWLKAPTTY